MEDRMNISFLKKISTSAKYKALLFAVILLAGCFGNAGEKKSKPSPFKTFTSTKDRRFITKRAYSQWASYPKKIKKLNFRDRSLTEEEIKALATEIKSLKDELAKCLETISSRNSQIRDLKNKYKNETDTLRSNLQKSRMQNEEMNKKQAAIETKLSELEKNSSAYREMTEKLNEEIKKGQVHITELEGKLKVDLLNKILFSSGSATIKESGKNVFKRVSEVLIKIKDKNIRIEGHTDSDPITGNLKKKYASNWELSAARATNVVRFLVEKTGINPGRISASAYGEFRPVASNATPEEKAKNRRIEIILVPRKK